MARTPNVYRSLQGQIKRKTDKAVLFQPHRADGKLEEELWFPLSQISSLHETYDEINGTFDVIMASEWILGTKGVLSLAGSAGVNPVTAAPNATLSPRDPVVFGIAPVPRSVSRYEDGIRAQRAPFKMDDADEIPF